MISAPGSTNRSLSFELLLTAALTLPWLWGVTYGPAVQVMGWLLVGAAGVLVLWGYGVRTAAGDVHADGATDIVVRWAWLYSLVLAALVSVGMACLQFTGLVQTLGEPLGLSLIPWISESAQGEAFANLRQRNQFACLTALGCLALLCWAQQSLPLAGGRWRGLALALCGAAVVWLALGNALSASRTGALQWGAMGLAVWVWRRSLRAEVKWLAGAALLAYGAWVALMPGLAAAVGNSSAGLVGRLDDGNALSRLALWANVGELILQKPGLGWGWGGLAYAHYSSAFESTRFMEMLDNAHNLPLHVAVELGLPAALLLCAGVGWALWRGRPWAERRADRQLAWGILLVIGIHSLVEYPLWYGPFFMTALLCVAVLCLGEEGQDDDEVLLPEEHLAPVKYSLFATKYIAKGVAILLLAATAFAAFDYHRVSQIYLQPAERSSWYGADALGAAQQSVLFKSHAKFAELVITPLSAQTAPRVLQLSSELVFWSPEPRVIEKLIESATMLEMHDVALFHWRRYRQAYPAAYEAWSGKLKAGAAASGS